MVKNGIVIISTEEVPLTLDELCATCHLTLDEIHALVEYEILHPKSAAEASWEFNMKELARVQKALRLQRDLEVNLAGVAIILDLLDQLDDLDVQREILEKHFMR